MRNYVRTRHRLIKHTYQPASFEFIVISPWKGRSRRSWKKRNKKVKHGEEPKIREVKNILHGRPPRFAVTMCNEKRILRFVLLPLRFQRFSRSFGRSSILFYLRPFVRDFERVYTAGFIFKWIVVEGSTYQRIKPDEARDRRGVSRERMLASWSITAIVRENSYSFSRRLVP